ncbi:LacI family DNA-binding transcriptional regulator [Paenibacillus campi]|uniref:LacI family DNA-binding transcriptional regulator n=1 Tax=Paenibacillus campi TaxID=3106031 RepID=UPI002AFE40C4|nr:LacI family DNA-binding transcriptional regulator [Paenibacillus sp. SGZ-1014]
MSKFDQIIKLSGYSRATVSRVINHSPHVSVEARAKITAIMEQLSYIPNRNAVSLSTGQTQQIGMVMANTNEVVLSFLERFIDIAMDYGFQTIIYTTRENKQNELRAFEDLRSKRVDGLVIITCVNDPKMLKTYCQYGPIVSWQRMGNDEIPSIAMDQGVGYTLALEHLVARGYTQIAHMFGRSDSLNTRSRREAYEHFMENKGLPVRRDWYHYSVFTSAHGEQMVHQLAAANELPQAVLCANDYVAIGILSAARRQRITVPEQLAIVGFDDSELARTLGITTIRNPIGDQAVHAFYRLWEVLGHEQIEPKRLEYELIARETT